jgi:hypothetical protein
MEIILKSFQIWAGILPDIDLFGRDWKKMNGAWVFWTRGGKGLVRHG